MIYLMSCAMFEPGVVNNITFGYRFLVCNTVIRQGARNSLWITI